MAIVRKKPKNLLRKGKVVSSMTPPSGNFIIPQSNVGTIGVSNGNITGTFSSGGSISVGSGSVYTVNGTTGIISGGIMSGVDADCKIIDGINAWEHIKSWLFAIEHNKEFKRKDLMTTMFSTRRHTLGCYLNMFLTAGYVTRPKRGVYMKVINPEINMNSKDLHILAYGSKDEKQHVKDKIK